MDNAELRKQVADASSTRETVDLRAELAALESNPRRFFLERYFSEPTSTLAGELEFEDQQARLAAIHHHRYSHLGERIFDGSADVALNDEDGSLVERIIAAYQRTARDDYYGPLWQHMQQTAAPIHDALMNGEQAVVAKLLRHPETNLLLYGFENVHAESATNHYHGWQQQYADRCKDVVVRLAEALGVLHVENPEASDPDNNITIDADRLVRHIEGVLGTTLPIVPAQSGFTGLGVSDGLVNERVAHGAYCAHRILRLLSDEDDQRVLEIGAGLGYVAYTAYRLGVHDYTIVDLPMTSVAQAYFLGRMLGEDKILLEGEAVADPHQRIKIYSPGYLHESHEQFALVLNVDSLPELGREIAADYAHKIFEISDTLLSINHERNQYTVNELFDPRQFSIDRRPFWLRNGYVEELVRPRSVPK
jgi:hypothetical protein